MPDDQTANKALVKKVKKIEGQYLFVRGLMLLSVLLAIISLLVGIQFPDVSPGAGRGGAGASTSRAAAKTTEEIQALKETVAQLTAKLAQTEGKLAALAAADDKPGQQSSEQVKCDTLTTQNLIIEDADGNIRGSIECKEQGTHFFIKHPTTAGRIELSVIGAPGRPTAASAVIRSQGGKETAGFAGYGEEGWLIPREE